MKKILKLITIIALLFTVFINANAATSTISVTSSTGQVIVGNKVTVYVTISSSASLGSWEYTLNYNSSIFKLTSSDVTLHYAASATNPSTKSITYKYVFQALKGGSGKFYVDSSSVIDWDFAPMNVNNGNKTVKVITYAEYQASLSSNNNLSSLGVEGYTLKEEFNKETLEYTVEVPEDTEKIVINAALEDGSASLNGTGEKEVSLGANQFDIVVVAQNGSEKTYKLTVNVIDSNPIIVNVGNVEYTLIKYSKNLVAPIGFEETKVVIDNIEIPAFYNETLEYTLVALKDSEANSKFFIYKDGTYTRYVELNFGNLRVIPVKMDEKITDHKNYTMMINDEDVEVLKIDSDNRYAIIKAINIEDAKESLYLYDSKDETLIKFYDEYYKKLNDKINLLIIVCASFFVLLIGSVIALLKKKNNNVKKDKPKKKSKISKYEINEDIETDSNEIKEKE